MLSSSTAAAAFRGRRFRLAVSLLAAAAWGYACVLILLDDPPNRPEPGRRSLRLAGVAGGEGADDPSLEWDDGRALAKSAADPNATDVVAGEYIVKPWVGRAASDVWEDKSETRVRLKSAQASTVMGENYLPRYAIDDPNLATRWASSKDSGTDHEWINIDMGMPMSIAEVYIKWFDAYAVAYKIFVSVERPGCRSYGGPCPHAWTEVVSRTGKSDSSATRDTFPEDDHALQGIRYVRIRLIQRAPGHENFSIYYLRVFRKKMVVGEADAGTSCGATVAAAASSLLGTYGGSLIRTYENAEFFAANMNEAQRDAMFADPCVSTAEPNWVVRARGRGGAGRRDAAERNRVQEHGAGRHTDYRGHQTAPISQRSESQERRRLAIPEFNLRDDNPPNWGLERISSHGQRNGKYTWFHEGTNTHIYIFDTALYPDHDEFNDRYGNSRISDGLICEGAADDYLLNDHGTHVASLAAGFHAGTAKDADIHPVQVLDANGEGSVASVLCGMEKLLQDGKDYNLEHAPRKIRAVVNLSLGTNGKSDALDKAVKDMTDVGYTVVIAAGDENNNACFYSPWDPTAIIVGAVSDHPQGFNDKTATSNYGECIDVWAPGEDIVGATNTAEFDTAEKSGTSVASAFVAGAACLFFEEIATEFYEIEEFSARVKEKIINKAEINILEDIGHRSVNKMVQTTSVRCLQNSHCDVGLTCLWDGMCWDMTKPLKVDPQFL